MPLEADHAVKFEGPVVRQLAPAQQMALLSRPSCQTLLVPVFAAIARFPPVSLDEPQVLEEVVVPPLAQRIPAEALDTLQASGLVLAQPCLNDWPALISKPVSEPRLLPQLFRPRSCSTVCSRMSGMAFRERVDFAHRPNPHGDAIAQLIKETRVNDYLPLDTEVAK